MYNISSYYNVLRIQYYPVLVFQMIHCKHIGGCDSLLGTSPSCTNLLYSVHFYDCTHAFHATIL